jgi:ribonuclease P/MRP protein subunit RPP40
LIDNIDFQKAFDSVPHERSMSKLTSYGITGTTANWIQNVLTDRQQRVVVDNEKSDWSKVTSGI